MDGTNANEKIKPEQCYPYMDDKHTLNSEGSFISKRVRVIENTLYKLKGSASWQAQKRQDEAQASIYERRIAILKDHGDFHLAVEKLDAAIPKNKGGVLCVDSDQIMIDSINKIKGIAEDERAGKVIGKKKPPSIKISFLLSLEKICLFI